ncbi:efflux RND transporter periplasmic adaptor subunit [Roseovarius sp. Pro17]|uniref:efflux RND transporter periplasmic adaptor subunit n=1 Tax=Roseovarius sp. Pro17 TaxID=3108175 RepID=UPI002D78B8A7|nr:HlyD family efflux transporter periplasmic adaptor subunit [Roseovarius sp. Pro17]
MRRGIGLLLPVALGVGVAAWLISTAEPPARLDEHERSVVARTITAKVTPVRAVVRGYGNVRAARSWEAISEISGTIIWRNPELDTGNVLRAGSEALKIDPTAYELAVAEAEADLAALEADIAQLDTDEANTGRLLALEQSRLDLTETELTRIRNLVERDVASQSAVDGQERATLQVRRGVAELQNALGLIPSRRNRLDAQMARTAAVLNRARRDLAKTHIVVPFDLRVGSVHVERHQYVVAGQPLVTADDIRQAEITAQIPVMAFRRLLGDANRNTPLKPEALPMSFAEISAEVRLVSDPTQTWPGRLVRVESALDPQARSVPAVVTVDDPYANANPPLRLPLVPNMYVELVLRGPVISESVTIPESAVHEGDLVYLRDSKGRLELRQVSVAWRQNGQAIIASGVEPGEEVILDDLMPAIPGINVIQTGLGE